MVEPIRRLAKDALTLRLSAPEAKSKSRLRAPQKISVKLRHQQLTKDRSLDDQSGKRCSKPGKRGCMQKATCPNSIHATLPRVPESVRFPFN